MRYKAAGFTLMELMIVVVIIGILTAIAYPNYAIYVLRSHRDLAEGDLETAANAMERSYASNNTYANVVVGTDFPSTSPFDGGTAYYNISIDNATRTATYYKLQATPTGSQTNDSCGTLSLDSTGVKGNSSGSNCW